MQIISIAYCVLEIQLNYWAQTPRVCDLILAKKAKI